MIPDPPVASPCIEVCKLDDANVCTGCGRSLDEIAEWSQAADLRRQEIRRLAQQRLATRNKNTTHG
ncbi:MAG: DUF1289 domain-containing protein [Stenotrophobium sp.]